MPVKFRTDADAGLQPNGSVFTDVRLLDIPPGTPQRSPISEKSHQRKDGGKPGIPVADEPRPKGSPERPEAASGRATRSDGVSR